MNASKLQTCTGRLGTKKLFFEALSNPEGLGFTERSFSWNSLAADLSSLRHARVCFLNFFSLISIPYVSEKKRVCALCCCFLSVISSFSSFCCGWGFLLLFPFFCCTCWCVFNFSLSPLRCVLLRFSFLAASSTFAFITQNLVAFKERATFLSVFTRGS